MIDIILHYIMHVWCLDGTCVQADGTSWSMILNATNNSALLSQPDDSVPDIRSSTLHSAASSLPVSHGTVTPPSLQVGRLQTTSQRTTTSNLFELQIHNILIVFSLPLNGQISSFRRTSLYI